MKVVVIGATGTIGKALVTALSGRHEVIRVSRKLGIKVDIEDRRSIQQLFDNVKPVDAVINCAGSAAFRALAQLTDEDLQLGIRSKLMGQIRLITVEKAKARRARSAGAFGKYGDTCS